MGICKHHHDPKNVTAVELHPKVPSDNRKNHLDDVTINSIPVSSKVEEEIQTKVQKNEPVAVPNLF